MILVCSYLNIIIDKHKCILITFMFCYYKFFIFYLLFVPHTDCLEGQKLIILNILNFKSIFSDTNLIKLYDNADRR